VDFAFGLRWFKPPKFGGTRGRQEKGARKKQMTLFFFENAYGMGCAKLFKAINEPNQKI
jgi:hypothetical protein